MMKPSRMGTEEDFEINIFNCDSQETEFDEKALGYLTLALRAEEPEVRDGVEGVMTRIEIITNGMSTLEMAYGLYGALEMFPAVTEELSKILLEQEKVKLVLDDDEEGDDDE